MKNFFVLIALLAASVFAAVGDEFVEDRSNATDEFVELTTESSEVMTDTDIKESVVKTAESDQPMDTIAKNETTTRHRLGAHERLNYTMLPYNRINVQPDQPSTDAFGIKDYTGIIYAYYFNDWFAIVTGLDFFIHYMKERNPGRVVEERESGLYYGGYYYENYDVTYRWEPLDEYSMQHWGVTIPLAARLDIAQLFWLQAGVEIDIPMGGKIKQSGPTINEETTIPSGELKRGVSIASSIGIALLGGSLEIALVESAALYKIDFCYSNAQPFSLGLEMIYWFF